MTLLHGLVALRQLPPDRLKGMIAAAIVDVIDEWERRRPRAFRVTKGRGQRRNRRNKGNP